MGHIKYILFVGGNNTTTVFNSLEDAKKAADEYMVEKPTLEISNGVSDKFMASKEVLISQTWKYDYKENTWI